jgi:hypothetical protein
MSTALDEIESLELANLNPEGEVPESRLSSAQAARAIYQSFIFEDQASAITRVRIQAMIDGEPPYNQAALNASGQGSRANANFLMGQDLIRKADNGYLDMFTSPKSLVTLDIDNQEQNQQITKSQTLASELTRTIRKWKGFTPSAQRLVNLFNSHGVGVSYFPDTVDFRFKVAGLGDFQIPRQTPAEEDAITIGIARQDISVTDLYAFIRDPEKAEAVGWNIAATKDAMRRATDKSAQGNIGDYEKFWAQLKSNDMYSAKQFMHVPLLHIWVREFDGRISYFIAEKDASEGSFLFTDHNRYENAEAAYTFFCYGVGNGTFHSIRGLGHMIYALVQLHNRLMCQKADGAMMDESIMVQAESNDALQEAGLNYLGPLSLLSPGFSVVQTKVSGSERTLPFLREVKGLMGTVSSRFMTPSADTQPGVYQNRDQNDFNMESIASGDSGAIDLFYGSLDRLFRQMCIRILDGPKTDPLVGEFHRRITKEGITEEDLKAIDRDSIYAFRTLGAGSPAARSVSFKKLLEILPQLDEVGRKNLIYEFVVDAVGYQNANIFASPADTPRLGVEAGIAETENFELLRGNPVKVFPEQMHATHVTVHLPKLIETLDMVERGELDPMENLPGLQAFLNHVAAHAEALAIDPTQQVIYNQLKEAINNTQQVVTNMERKIKAEERKMLEQGPPPEQGAPGYEDAMAQTKLAIEQRKLDLAQFQFDLARALGEMKIADQQTKSIQALALADIKGAEQAALQGRFPGTTMRERTR